MVTALPEFHHDIHQTGGRGALAEMAEVPLQDGSVVLLLDVGQLHLDDGLLLGLKTLLHVLFQSTEHHRLEDVLEGRDLFLALTLTVRRQEFH